MHQAHAARPLAAPRRAGTRSVYLELRAWQLLRFGCRGASARGALRVSSGTSAFPLAAHLQLSLEQWARAAPPARAAHPRAAR